MKALSVAFAVTLGLLVTKNVFAAVLRCECYDANAVYLSNNDSLPVRYVAKIREEYIKPWEEQALRSCMAVPATENVSFAICAEVDSLFGAGPNPLFTQKALETAASRQR